MYKKNRLEFTFIVAVDESHVNARELIIGVPSDEVDKAATISSPTLDCQL